MRVNSPPQCLFPPTSILTFHRKLKTEATQSWMPTLIPCRITYIMRAMDFLVGTGQRSCSSFAQNLVVVQFARPVYSLINIYIADSLFRYYRKLSYS